MSVKPIQHIWSVEVGHVHTEPAAVITAITPNANVNVSIVHEEFQVCREGWDFGGSSQSVSKRFMMNRSKGNGLWSLKKRPNVINIQQIYYGENSRQK